MPNPGFWESLSRDLSGHGIFGGRFQFRLVLQPLAAIILGIRVGIRDAKQGELPFFQALFRGTGQRSHLLLKAARDAILPLIVAFTMDSILQHMINGRVRPLAAVIVGGLLVFLPFVIVRAVTNRIWTHGQAGGGQPAKQSR